MANVANPFSRTQPGRPFVILKAGPVKVAVVGLCFVHTSLPSAWALNVDDPIQTAAGIVPKLCKQADVVVALMHLGVEEDKKLAAAVPGIDIIVGGHSHTALPHGIMQVERGGRTVLICQAGEYLDYIGKAAGPAEAHEPGVSHHEVQRRIAGAGSEDRPGPEDQGQDRAALGGDTTGPDDKSQGPGTSGESTIFDF